MEIFYSPLAWVIIIVLIESFLFLSWNPIYYRYGIPIFFSKYPIFPASDFSYYTQMLEDKCSSGSWFFPPLVFRALTPYECAFREGFSFFRGRYSIVMRGFIRSNPDKGYFIIIGYLNWSIPFVALFFALTPIGIFIFIILIVLYIIQAYRYKQVGRIAVECFSKPPRQKSKRRNRKVNVQF